MLEIPRAEGVLAPGTHVSALLIDDLGRMPMPIDPSVPSTAGFV